ncbi:MAG: PDZ domain-containing protein [Halanaerobiaceae bacterium]|jgi:PDZ domain-containing protein|nr:PDZ domain-containing protein [Halanaerobiaceae bacterium]
MCKKKIYISRIVFIILLAMFLSLFFPTSYMVMSPGVAMELSSIITVEDAYHNQGKFLLTAVSTKRAELWEYLYINLFNPVGLELDKLPEGLSMDKYIEIMDLSMDDSKNIAKTVAFKKAGYDVKVRNNGVVVNDVLSGGAAEGKLKKGDLIIAVDGKEVQESQDVIDMVRSCKIGEEITITVRRNYEELDFTMKTISMDDEPEQSFIGVRIYTDREYVFPKEVSFETQNIGGASAGSMFTLEIYNQLVEEDITKGKRIAGTGTIDLDGSIGEIDGVVQKVLAAERKNAEVFFVPVENYEEARKIASKIKLVAIENIDEAIQYLKQN